MNFFSNLTLTPILYLLLSRSKSESYLLYEKKMSSFILKNESIHWKNGLPYCYSPTLKKDVCFKSLHFQGAYKDLMGNYRAKKCINTLFY
jgi:hypothetical protein